MLSVVMSGVLLTSLNNQWTAEQANKWQAKQPWVVGANFLPSTAINQLEMWQAESWDPVTIDRELGWAEGIGMNTVRVYLHDLAYQADPKGFKKRMSSFLQIASKHKIRPLFVFFDDCWNPNPSIGMQPAPKKGVHNSGWVRSPGDSSRSLAEFPRLKVYVQDILRTFSKDKRVYLWDLYNEPGNSGYELKSVPLLNAVFDWAQEVRPSQPLSVGVWYGNETLNKIQLDRSDVVTFHNYNDTASLSGQIASLKALGRPVVCTEWMARTNNSRVLTHLGVFKDAGVAAINWGLVSGKSNTIFPWGSKEGGEEPKVWFHDLFRQDGTPFDAAEIAEFRRLTGRS
ncbi:MAG: cellulase family glycosylhydrolase [Armatimonadota bacterium]